MALKKRVKRVKSLLWHSYLEQYHMFTFGSGKVLLLSVLVGILAAFGAIFFQIAVDFSKFVFLGKVVGLPLHGPAGEITLFHLEATDYRWYMLLIVPALGGLISGILVFKFAPEAKGHGTDGVIEAYHMRRGIIRPIVPVIKTIASAITIGTGGSAGKEGPIAQIAAGMASAIGKSFNLSARHMRIMIIAGLAAGIGATFRAPLAAGLFAAEVLYREMDFDREVIMPALVSPIIAYAVFTMFFQAGPLFATPDLAFEKPWELLPYTLVALVAGLGARSFVAVFDRSESFFEKMTIPAWLKPAVGGFLVGLIGLVAPQALSESYGMLQQAHLNELGFGMILFLIIAKVATTSLTIGSGGSGGVFGPSIVIGGLIGGLVGIAVNTITPVSQSAYVIVGMAGFFSAAANTPISTIFMVSEMTGSYSLLVPTMWVSSLAYILGRGSTLYKKQLWNHYEAPAQLEELRAAILEKMTVGGACGSYDSLELVGEKTPFNELDERLLHEQRVFGVTDHRGVLIGEITPESIRHARNRSQENLIAADLMDHVETVRPSQSLWVAMQKMLRRRRDRLFVVNGQDEPISYLKKQDIMTAYDRRMSGMDHESLETPVQEEEPTEDLPIRSINYDQECKDQLDVLRFLSRSIAPKNQKKADAYFISLLEREELGSTAMGHGFAFPHPHQRDIVEGQRGIHILTTTQPLDFKAPDREGVDKFILFWFSNARQHIDALSLIAGAVADGRLEKALQEKASEHELMAILGNSDQSKSDGQKDEN